MSKSKKLFKVSVIFILVLLVATFFSRSILYFVTPKVLLSRGTYDMESGGLILPLTALIDDESVYTAQMKNGFSGQIMVLERKKITVLWRDQENVSVQGVDYIDLIVVDWDRELHDGQRVMYPIT